MATATKERPERIATNVQSRGGSSPGAKTGASGDAPAGKRKGKSMKVKDLRSDSVQKQTDLELTKTISGGKGKMPPYGKQLSTAEIEAIIAFVRTLKAK